jgi:hypothetical protein
MLATGDQGVCFMAKTTIQLLWKDRSICPEFRAGVSLHSHTMYSEESLGIIPHYTQKIPFLGRAVQRELQRYQQSKSEPLDLAAAFWTPPLSPKQAFRLEHSQLQNTFQLPSFVSLTDHDDIRAGAQLQVLNEFRNVPVSTEWTIPFGPTFFHLGVHNLPPAKASGILSDLAAYTASPQEPVLSQLLADLNSFPDVLLVLNHPLWDEKGIGLPEHAQVLGRLLERHGRHFHALEVNGLRSFKENQQVIWLGQQAGLPVVSGGDRHGLEPNAIANLSWGRSFAEFIHEVRHRKRSHVVFMPQYREPLRIRVLQTMVDVVRDYPDNLDGRRCWSDRVYYRPPQSSTALPLSHFWKHSKPLLIESFVRAMRLAEFRGVKSALRLALNERPLWSDQEASI